MTDAPVARFNQYEVIAPLGKGGMGEVYRARDTRLNREVALKVLPVAFAQDADRLRRFELEARATSALNHPNILTVYDFGTGSPENGGNPFIVMELLEGEELRAQLDQGAIAPRKAMEYAQQIVAGLAAAHEKGIVHRDLKPENLFVTHDGRVKILDFGLAKLRPPRTISAGSEVETQKQYTTPGTVMGTVAYMSPEQVNGQDLDHRSDIFSFGIILHEMLSGQRAFTGESHVEVMHAILKNDPPELSEANAKIPPQLEKIVRRCLEKKPERRFQTASDLGFALETLATPGSAGVSPATSAGTAARSSHEEIASSSANSLTRSFASLRSQTAGRMPAYPGWRERIAWIGLGIVSLALLALGVAYLRRPPLEAEPMRLYLNPPEKAIAFDWPAISPDGRTLAYYVNVEGKRQIWVRSLNSTTAKPLADVLFGERLFWSPDSQFIGFIDQGSLKKMALSGGTPVTLGEVSGSSGTWNREGIILLGAGTDGVKRISANGGAVSTVTTVDSSRGETFHLAPVFLPDGRHFIFYKGNSDATKSGAYLASLDSGETKLLLPVGSPIVKVASNPAAKNEGYLVFVRQGALLAQSFDFSRNQLMGEPVRLAEQVQTDLNGTNARFSLSENGVLIFIEGNADQQLAWFDRAGKKLGIVGSAGRYAVPRLSPDEQLLAVSRRDSQSQSSDIRVLDMMRGTDTRFTFDLAEDTNPLWSPDGSRLAWVSRRVDGVRDLYWKAANGGGEEELLCKSASDKYLNDWSKDGRFILYQETNPQTNNDLWILPLEGERKPWLWLKTEFIEQVAKFSPDGKWIAYTSNESGGFEVYVRAFVPDAPASGGKWQISTNGGSQPKWRRDGRELYYVSADHKLMAVEVTLGAEVKAGTPKALFDLRDLRATTSSVGFASTTDGQRFLFVTSAEEASVPPFTVVLNWMAEVQK